MKTCEVCSSEPCNPNCSVTCTQPIHQTPAGDSGLCKRCEVETKIADAYERNYRDSVDRALGYSDDE